VADDHIRPPAGVRERRGRGRGTARELIHPEPDRAFSHVHQAWCDFNDTFCASGVDTVTHLTRYQNRAASFILGRVGG
jgi:hypothetical protein